MFLLFGKQLQVIFCQEEPLAPKQTRVAEKRKVTFLVTLISNRLQRLILSASKSGAGEGNRTPVSLFYKGLEVLMPR
jgi:hypothetical protein